VTRLRFTVSDKQDAAPKQRHFTENVQLESVNHPNTTKTKSPGQAGLFCFVAGLAAALCSGGRNIEADKVLERVFEMPL